MQLPAAAIQDRVDAIRSDNRSGSVELTRQAADALLEAASLDPFRPGLEKTCVALVRAQPSMASIVNLASIALWNGVSPASLRSVCRQFTGQLDEANRRISGHARQLIRDGQKVLTYSRSRTVVDALIGAHNAGASFEVLCTESRPMGEGIKLARDLAEAGIPVRLSTDAALFRLAQQASLIIVGADALTNQSVVNKTGTSMLVMAGRHLSCSTYVLSGSEKFVPRGYRLPGEESKPASEISAEPLPGVQIDNRYFESVPLGWIAAFITEEGRLTSWQLRERLQHNEAHPLLTSDS